PNEPSPEGTIIEKDPQSYQKPEQELPQIKIIPTEEELIQQARQAKINASPPSKNPKFPQNQTPEKEPTPIIKDIITNSTIFQKDHLEVPNKGWTKLDFKSPNEIIRVFTKQGLLMGFIIQIENGIQFISYLQNYHFILTENDPAKIVGRTDIHERPTNKKFSNSQFSLTYQNSSFCIMDGNYQTRAKSTNGTAIDKVTITENSIAQMEHPLLTKLFPQGIDQTTFKQRNIGDCTLLAALIVILKLPYAHKLINNLFNKSIDYHNGNYTILFPHYPDRPIRISEEDLNREAYDDQGNLRQGVESESLGVKLLEVAWGRLIKQEGWADRAHKKSKQRIINNPSDLSSERITNEDQSIATINTMLALHEGHDNKGSNYVLEAIFSDNGRHFVIGSDEFLAEGVSEKTLAESDTSIQIKIIEKLIKHAENPDNMPLIAYTPIREKKFVDDQKRFPRKHAFGILKVDKMQRQVFISNPWDSSSPAEAISFDEFFKYFTALVGTELNDKLSGTSGQNSLAKTIQAKFTKIALIPTPTPSKQETKTTRSWLKKIFRKK
ncbi:hypothetical protein KKG71_05940, partial [Patescibacteria group bacterium]|nr:hypothetical protein [Patescibacteria group bacterium]